jgi:UDP-N-acetylglucosamine diphosphorylase/glucosamine-1-phosphate N-acetyltransferase
MPISHLILFDGNERRNLLPLSATRSIADFRIGILTIREKWEKCTGVQAHILTEPYLQPKYVYRQEEGAVFVNASFLPESQLAEAIEKLPANSALRNQHTVIAVKTDSAVQSANGLLNTPLEEIYIECDLQVRNLCDIFLLNGREIANDIRLMKLQPNPEVLSGTNTLIGRENIYVEEGVVCEASSINAKNGPVYFGKNSEVMEGAAIRGPFALCNHSTVKMQAKIYGDTTIGPHCKVGGELSNAVLFGYSNKAHDGFLGNSVIGEWCNLGADTNNSNLKNNYGIVKAWSYAAKAFQSTGLQFCGLMMGDHSKCGINTMFNTGTVTGVCANIFGGGFPPKFVPDFSWGGASGFEAYDLGKCFEAAGQAMSRRGLKLTDQDKNMLEYIFETTREFRN